MERVPDVGNERKPDKQEREVVYVIRAMKTKGRESGDSHERQGGSTKGEDFHQEAWRIPLDPVIMLFPLRYPPNCGGG